MKTYLGDSVYASHDGYVLTLTTENGFGPSNTIYLEPQVLDALDAFRERITAAQQAPADAEPAS